MKERLEYFFRSWFGYKRALSNKKGSPTMEYIVIIAVGALFAGILYNVFSGENASSIQSKIKTFVEKQVDGAINSGGDSGSDQNKKDDN